MKNADKIILDLCGGTGAWSLPYKKAGYRIYVITLPGYDVTSWTISDDGEYIIFYGQNGVSDLKIEIARIYGILAAPPCTMISFARTRRLKPRNFAEGLIVVNACMNIIQICRLRILYKKDGALRFWALENPKGFLRQFIGMPYLEFDPCDFGDPWIKRTDIFGYFNLPRKNPIEVPPEIKVKFSTNSALLHKLPKKPAPLFDDDGYTLPSHTESRTARRAITPPGFANAFFKMNR